MSRTFSRSDDENAFSLSLMTKKTDACQKHYNRVSTLICIPCFLLFVAFANIAAWIWCQYGKTILPSSAIVCYSPAPNVISFTFFFVSTCQDAASEEHSSVSCSGLRPLQVCRHSSSLTLITDSIFLYKKGI